MTHVCIYKINSVLPYHKDEYETYESFYTQIVANIKTHDLNPLDEELELMTKLFYNLSNEEYDMITASGLEYRHLKKIASDVNRALLNNYPVEDILAIFDMYTKMTGVISRFVAGVYSKYRKYKKEAIGELIKNNDRAVGLCQDYIYDAIANYCNDVLLNEIIDKMVSYDSVREELDLNVNMRNKTYQRKDGKNEENRYIGHVVLSKERYQRAHGTHKNK